MHFKTRYVNEHTLCTKGTRLPNNCYTKMLLCLSCSPDCISSEYFFDWFGMMLRQSLNPNTSYTPISTKHYKITETQSSGQLVTEPRELPMYLDEIQKVKPKMWWKLTSSASSYFLFLSTQSETKLRQVTKYRVWLSII